MKDGRWVWACAWDPGPGGRGGGASWTGDVCWVITAGETAVRGGTHQVSGARQASAVKGSHEAHSGCVTEPAQLSFLPQLQGLPPLSWREGLRGPGWVVAWGVAGRWHVLLERGCGSGVCRASLVSREREEVPLGGRENGGASLLPPSVPGLWALWISLAGHPWPGFCECLGLGFFMCKKGCYALLMEA